MISRSSPLEISLTFFFVWKDGPSAGLFAMWFCSHHQEVECLSLSLHLDSPSGWLWPTVCNRIVCAGFWASASVDPASPVLVVLEPMATTLWRYPEWKIHWRKKPAITIILVIQMTLQKFKWDPPRPLIPTELQAACSHKNETGWNQAEQSNQLIEQWENTKGCCVK